MSYYRGDIRAEKNCQEQEEFLWNQPLRLFKKESLIFIEINGSSHYSNITGLKNVKTEFKETLLREMTGGRVIGISNLELFEMSQMGKTASKQKL